MKQYAKGAKVPSPPPPPPPPDPDNSAAKNAAAEAKARERRRAGTGSMNRTLATSPLGVSGPAPASSPSLKGQLG